MKRRTRFAISILAAAITFGSLMVFAKPMNGFNHRDKSPFGFTENHDCYRGDGVNSKQKNPGREKDLKSIDSLGSAQEIQ